MRVLMVTVELPYLTGAGGGNLRQYDLLRRLSEVHEIWLVTAALPWEMDKASEVAPFCARLEVVPHHFRFGPARRRSDYWLNRLAYLRSLFPFQVERYQHLLPEFRKRVEGLLHQEGLPDLLDVEQSNIAHWRALVPGSVSTVLVLHNVMTEVARLALGLRRPWRERILDRVELWKTRAYERRELAGYDHLVAVSEPDREAARALAPASRVSVVPNGVDVDFFGGEAADREGTVAGGSRLLQGDEEEGLLFVGSMNYHPNEDAALYFAREIYPMIKAAKPNATLGVVGRSPSARLMELHGRDGVAVAGGVPDVRPHLREAAVVVVPLRYGGGTRLKILEALAAGKAVVSTRIGAAGLDLTDGKELLLADEPEAFARAVVGLLEDPARRVELGRRGRATVEARFDWSQVATKLDAVLRETARVGVKDQGPSL